MAQFAGYLIKNDLGANLNKFIQFDTYNSTPNQREEIVAYRDDNSRNLYRVTAQGKKTSISFTTKSLNLATKIAFQQFFTNATINALQRKVHLTYWNDEDNTYKESYFYLPDINFTVRRISDTDILYNPLTVDLVEY